VEEVRGRGGKEVGGEGITPTPIEKKEMLRKGVL